MEPVNAQTGAIRARRIFSDPRIGRSSHMPLYPSGLATEAETAEALVEKLKTLIPELLSLNGRTDTKPIAFELLTRRFELAA